MSPGLAEEPIISPNHLHDKIEILPVELLEQQRTFVNELKQTARSLGLEFGWHYLLDLTWILSHLGPVAGKRILDAGAGTGILQWYLASKGAEVISVDRSSRAALPLRFRAAVRVEGLRPQDLSPAQEAIRVEKARRSTRPWWQRTMGDIKHSLKNSADLQRQPHSLGKVIIYNQDLADMPEIQDGSIDAVVAVSALEHNTPEGLVGVVSELMRVLKPGGNLLATVCAAREADWYHQPSSGWCYSDASLRRSFSLPEDTPSNYAEYDRIMDGIRNCAELRDHLASFYFKSANNGMPMGIWDPKYPPVGVLKHKPGSSSAGG